MCAEAVTAQAQPITAQPGAVERLELGMPGYRMRLPEKVHPISAGVKGGLLGGLVMPLPALCYSLLSGHGIWYPLNLLAGMVMPGVGRMSSADLSQFHLTLFVVGVLVHITMSAGLGLALRRPDADAAGNSQSHSLGAEY